MKLFCNHKWKVLDKHVFPSQLKAGSIRNASIEEIKELRKAGEDRVSVLVCCDVCGSIKRYDM